MKSLNHTLAPPTQFRLAWRTHTVSRLFPPIVVVAMWVLLHASPLAAVPMLQEAGPAVGAPVVTDRFTNDGDESGGDTAKAELVDKPAPLIEAMPTHMIVIVSKVVEPTMTPSLVNAPDACFAEIDGDNVTDYASTDSSAVRLAVAAVSTGGTVKLAGTCAGVATQNGSTQLARITQTLTLQGGYTNTNWANSDPNTNPTTLDAQGAGRVLSVTVAATVQGLTVTQGVASGSNTYGGGIYALSALTLSNVTVYSNTTSGVGAVYVTGGARVSGSTFYSNSAGIGGGLYGFTNTYVSASQFTKNHAGIGGGMYGFGAAQVTDSAFVTNSANIGGGLYVYGISQLTNANFTSNSADIGGGLYVYGASQLTYTAFTSNSAVIGGGLDAYGAALMNHVTFVSNHAIIGGASNMYTSGDIQSSSFFSNSADIGGAIAMYGPIAITDTTFADNIADLGGGAQLYGTVQMKRVVFSHNSATYGGGVYLNSNAGAERQLSNVLFANNVATSTAGVAIYAAQNSNVSLVQVTIAASELHTGSAVYMRDGSGWFTNTLIANHAVGYERASGSITESNSLFSGVTAPYSGTIAASSNSLTGTALFVDPASDDYHLSSNSAGINAGIDADVGTDYDGEARPQGGGFDIGYDETGYSVGLQLRTSSVTPVGASTALTATLSNAVITGYVWEFGDGSIGSSAVSATYPDQALISHTYAGAGSYTATVKATTNLGDFVASGIVQVGVAQCFAEYNGDNVTDFNSTDANALRDAIAAASAGGTVKVAGTCAGAITQDGTAQVALIAKTLTVQGGYTNTDWTTSDPSTNPTTLDAQGGGRVLYAKTAVTMQGLTMTNGAIDDAGGGIRANSRLTLTAVMVYSNTSTAIGGGLYVAGSTTIADSRFLNNTATGGGGAALFNADTNVSGTLFSANKAVSGDGGAVIASDPITLTNSKMINNSASATGGGLIAYWGAKVIDSEFVSNTATSGGAVYIIGDIVPSQIVGSRFEWNAAIDEGGAVFIEADSNTHDLSITTTTFLSNSAAAGGGALYVGNGATTTLENSLLVHNSSTTGLTDIGLGGSNLPAGLIARHDTFVGNGTGTAIEVGHDVDNEQATLSNVIIDGYATGLATAARPASILADGVVWFNVTTPIRGTGITVTHAYTGDPGFVDRAGDNFHISSTSAALNWGVVTDVATDFDGDVRPQGGGYDLGYDETSYAVGLSVVNNGPTMVGAATQFTATLSNGANFTYTWDFGDGSVVGPAGLSVGHVYVSTGDYTVTITATNGLEGLSAASSMVVLAPNIPTPTPTATSMPTATKTPTSTPPVIPSQTPSPTMPPVISPTPILTATAQAGTRPVYLPMLQR